VTKRQRQRELAAAQRGVDRAPWANPRFPFVRFLAVIDESQLLRVLAIELARFEFLAMKLASDAMEWHLRGFIGRASDRIGWAAVRWIQIWRLLAGDDRVITELGIEVSSRALPLEP
jgi:hypothetical protein